MSLKIIPEGFEDDVTEKASTEHGFKNLIINHFQKYGYQLVKTPLIEFDDNQLDKNIFNILVKKKEKKLIIRDDITMQVARLSYTRLAKKPRPLKLCYYGEVVRKKGTMLRPERQFLQIGAECIGEKNYLADVEMLELAYSSLQLVGIKDMVVEISSRIFFDKFINNIQSSGKIKKIKNLIKLKDLKGLINILDKKDHNYIKNLFSCTGIFQEKIKNLDQLIIDDLTSKEIKNIKKIVKVFLLNNKKAKIFLDLCEIEDKNYHTGLRFTFFANNVRGEIARGGRYSVRNNKNYDYDEATGFTCYMDSILRASSIKIVQKKILIPFDTKINKIKELINLRYVISKNFKELDNIKKIAKEQKFDYYLEKNKIKKL